MSAKVKSQSKLASGKKVRPLEKGQQTLAAFLAKAKSPQKLSRCPVCQKQVTASLLPAHQKSCKTPVYNNCPIDDDDSDVEIIDDPTPKSPRAKSTPSTPLSAGAAGSTNGAAASPATASPCLDAAPAWGSGSPCISSVVGGAAALCETAWSRSDSASERTDIDSPPARPAGRGIGGWLVSPTRSPSVSPGGREMAPPAATPSSRLTLSGARVRLSPAVAGRTGRFAHSGLLTKHLPPPPSPTQSPPARSSPRQSQSPRQSPNPSPSRRLPKTNPLRYLSSPSSARRRLYRTDSRETLDSGAPAAGSATEPPTGQNTAADTREGDAIQDTEGEPTGGTPEAALKPPGGGRSNGLLPTAMKLPVPNGLLRAASEELFEAPPDALDGDLSAEEERILSQEFSQEMPELTLLASPQKPDLSAPYYLQNFLFIVESVLADELHAPLLDAEDLEVIQRFRALPPPAQMLYVRMFQRKHAWLRAEKLRYSEVGGEAEVGVALGHLDAAQLVDTERQLSGAAELAELLSAPELRQLCQQLHITASGPRPELLARLAEHGRRQGRLMFGAASPAEVVARRARALLGRCVRVAAGPRRVLLRVLSLFHLPLYEDDEDTSQQLLTLLMVNLGRMVYPPVTVLKQTAIFGCRDDLLRYEAASQLEHQLRSAMEAKRWQEAYCVYQAAEEMAAELSSRPELERFDAELLPFLRRFTAGSIVTYVRTKGVEVLQRRREHVAAVALLRSLLGQSTYLPDYRGFWSERLALTLQQHLRRPGEALEAARGALADPEVRGGRRLALEQRVARLQPSPDCGTLQPHHLPSVDIEARCLPRDVPGLKMVFLQPEAAGTAAGDVTVCSVEELALAHYSSRYSEGVHREGAPTVTLFALLFWDLLYDAEVADSFRSAYQTIPLDLNSPAFHARRRRAVEDRLAELAAGSAEDACRRVEQVWQAHHGCLSLASWDVFRDCEHALGLLRCLGVPLVCAICRRLATEYRFTRSGFPDLVLWNPADGSARIVEVKGPNDRLSTKQMLWIRYLLDHGAAAEVCYVKALGRRGGGAKRMAAASPRKARRPAAPAPAPAPAPAHAHAPAPTGEGEASKGTRRTRKTGRGRENGLVSKGAKRGRRKVGKEQQNEAPSEGTERVVNGTAGKEDDVAPSQGVRRARRKPTQTVVEEGATSLRARRVRREAAENIQEDGTALPRAKRTRRAPSAEEEADVVLVTSAGSVSAEKVQEEEKPSRRTGRLRSRRCGKKREEPAIIPSHRGCSRGADDSSGSDFE